jgi:hypothetical protein
VTQKHIWSILLETGSAMHEEGKSIALTPLRNHSSNFFRKGCQIGPNTKAAALATRFRLLHKEKVKVLVTVTQHDCRRLGDLKLNHPYLKSLNVRKDAMTLNAPCPSMALKLPGNESTTRSISPSSI